MGRNEIRFRRSIIKPDDIQRYQNYSALMKQYERTRRFKRALRIFIYSLLLTIVLVLLLFGVMWLTLHSKKQQGIEDQKKQESSMIYQDISDDRLIENLK